MSEEKVILTPEEVKELAREARKPLTPAELEEKADNIRKSEHGAEVLKLANHYREARSLWFAEKVLGLLPPDKRQWVGEGDEGWQKVKAWFATQGFRLRQYDDLTATIEHGGKVLCKFVVNLKPKTDDAKHPV